MNHSADVGVPRRPLLGIALLFALGVGFGMHGWVSVRLPATLFPFLLAAWVLASKSGLTRPALAVALLAVFTAGIVVAVGSVARNPVWLPHDDFVMGQPVTVQGRICRHSGWHEFRPGSLRVNGCLRQAQVRMDDGERDWQFPRLLFTWFGPDTRHDPDFGIGVLPMPGEVWQFTGTLRSVPSAGVAGTPWRLTTSVRNAQRLQPARTGLSGFAVRIREQLYRRLTLGVAGHPLAFAVLRAMLLGDRAALPADLRRDFTDSGTLHIFAVSGLHVGLLCLAGISLLRLCGVSRRYWLLFLGPVMLCYVLAVGMRPSALRAACMVCLYLLAPLCGRRPDTLSALSGAALIMLALQPESLLTAGFLLSFGVVAGLLVWTPRLLALMKRGRSGRLAALDHRATAIDNAGSTEAAASSGGIGRIATLFAVSLAAWLSSVPLTAYFFQRFIWVGIPANLLMTPLAFLTVAGASASLLGGLFLPSLAQLFNHAVVVLAYTMVAVARVAAALPAATTQTGPVPVWVAVVGYIGLLRLGLALPAPDGPHADAPRLAPGHHRQGVLK